MFCRKESIMLLGGFMLERLELMIGEDNIKKIEDKTFLVIGLGGVGGYALESLVRSGAKKVIIVDYDKVDILLQKKRERSLIFLRKAQTVYRAFMLCIHNHIDGFELYP